MAPISSRLRNSIKVSLSIESSRVRASLGVPQNLIRRSRWCHLAIIWRGIGDPRSSCTFPRPESSHCSTAYAAAFARVWSLQPALRRSVRQRSCSAEAAFAKPKLYEALEERDVKYAIRLPANDILERDIGELLSRPVGRRWSYPVSMDGVGAC